MARARSLLLATVTAFFRRTRVMPQITSWSGRERLEAEKPASSSRNSSTSALSRTRFCRCSAMPVSLLGVVSLAMIGLDPADARCQPPADGIRMAQCPGPPAAQRYFQHYALFVLPAVV